MVKFGTHGKSPKSKKSKVDPRLLSIRGSLTLWWKLSSVLAALATLLMIVSLSTASWLITDSYAVNYMQSIAGIIDKPQTKSYSNSYYGLFLVYFNGGTTIEPWYQKSSDTCSGFQLLQQSSIANSIVSLWSQTCGSDCLDHFQIRCNYYKTLSTYGFVLMAALLLVVAASLTAIAWLHLFGKSPQFLRASWLGGGFVALIGSLAFIYLGHTANSSLRIQSMYPVLNIGYSAWCGIASSILLIIAGLIVAFAAHRDSVLERRVREEEIVKQEAGGINFRIGGQPTMANNGVGRPMFLPPPRLPPR